jgi:hypothetical protein
MTLRSDLRTAVLLGAILTAAAPLATAQVYKWVDEKGVVNYGNKPPAPAKGAKGPTVVEDRVSVYTPDPAVTQATQNARERSALPNPGGYSSQTPPERRATPPMAAAPVPPPPAGDPCATLGDVNCSGYPAYDGYPYAGRFRSPRLVQPQLPPGSIAGNVNGGNGYIPGLSTQAPVVTPPPAPLRPQSRSILEREDRGGRSR